MLTEMQKIDKIEVLENGVIQVRVAQIIEKESVEISRSYVRYTLAPGDDISGQNSQIQAISLAVWTPEIVAAWMARRLENMEDIHA